ncbi:carboxylesterase family protein [Deinococcus detaillensis]|uniref:Carboxylesterase family protein n=1 Tax=Deinococcus detaillensis TaxID=2592048 RepID=A0A553UK12_9DEIO|nr:carboxylesterase/lipase family protein [Deinococcus detaillensis]TSA80540.1 carboxylesterase family protein [Deinococcus detaillensis]
MRVHVQTLLGFFALLGGFTHAQESAPPSSPQAAPQTAPLTPQTVPTRPESAQPADNLALPDPDTIIQASVTSGLLGGREVAGVNQFLGVPYAAPPLGDLRWKAPQPMPAWPGRRDASRPGDICIQRPNAITGNPDRTLSGSEDCLYLNVYAPLNAAAPEKNAAPKNTAAPVMVWIHGGSFDTGTGSIYDGSVLAREYGVVVITLNYRLGPLGFLAAPALGPEGTGNYGLMDIQAALRWVQSNAAAFGGDPHNVTAFGESAGGIALCGLLTSPLSQGLFQKAILQSGPCAAGINTAPLTQALDIGARYTQDLGCPNTPAGAECLRGKTSTELMNVTVPGSRAPNAVALPPIYGDAVLPTSPYQAYQTGLFTHVPVLIGTNHDEGTLFTAYLAGADRAMSTPLYWGLLTVLNPPKVLTLIKEYPDTLRPTTGLTAAAVVTDGLFACPVASVTGQLSRFVPTYAYEFSDPQAVSQLSPTRSVPSLGAYHASELIYVFGTALSGLADPADFTPVQRQLSKQMQQYWTNFARTGNPSGAEPSTKLTPWAATTPQRPNWLTLAPQGNIQSGDFLAQHHCAFWDELDGR